MRARVALVVCLSAWVAARAETRAKVSELFVRAPLAFEASAGRDARRDFLARGQGYALRVRSSGMALTAGRAQHSATVRMILEGARAVAPEALDGLPGKANYLYGPDPARWRRDVPTFGKVRYRGVYPGIDVVYYGNRGRLEYDFVLAPGADARSVILAFYGTRRLLLSPDGALLLDTAAGRMRFEKPSIYQQTAGGRKPVEGRYRLLAGNRAAFDLGAYDRGRPVVIDPTLVYESFLDGLDSDIATGIALDAAGNAYITGTTYSPDFPTAGPYQAGNHGSSDVFVTKLDAGGNIVYSTYLGGEGRDSGAGIAADNTGKAYLTGTTDSLFFPVTPGAFQTTRRSSPSAFVTALNATGNGLVYSTYLGGTAQDGGAAIAVDKANGNVWVAGDTISTDFPVSPGAYQTPNRGGQDIFAVKFNATGQRQYGAILGGSAVDNAGGIAVDAAGNAYVTGQTFSPDLPTTPGVIQTASAGAPDAFVSKLDATGATLLLSTYLGGSQGDHGRGIAVHSSGAVYVVGSTFSPDFVTTPGALQATAPVGRNGFFVKLSADLRTRVFSTYIGGRKDDNLTAIALDEPAGNAYITGDTLSPDFPVLNALQAAKIGSGTMLFHTTNTAAAWTPSDAGIGEGTPLSVWLSGSTELVSTDSSIYRSANGGVSWTRVATTPAYALARGGGVLFAGAQGTVYKSTDNGVTWNPTGSIPGLAQALAAVNASLVYAGTGGSGVYVTTNGGSSWAAVNTGLGSAIVQSLVVDPTNPAVVYAGTDKGLYKSTSGGAAWAPSNIGAAAGSVYSIAIDPAAPTKLFASFVGGIYQSINGGASWTLIPGISGQSIALAPSNPNVIYVASNDFPGGLFVSTNGGTTWTPANAGIDAWSLDLVAVDPANPAAAITAGRVTSDVVALKLSASGAPVYSTYLGGIWFDGGTGVAADAAGNLYLAGASQGVTFAGAERVLVPWTALALKITDTTAACSYRAWPPSLTVYPWGTVQGPTIEIAAPSGCAWNVTPPAWITPIGPSSGAGMGMFSFAASANSGPERTATLTIGNQSVTVRQASVGCSYALDKSSVQALQPGGTFTLNLTTSPGCAWDTTSYLDWITVSPPSGTGTDAVTVTVAPSGNPTPRTGSIHVGSIQVSVTQSGTCSFALSAPSAVAAFGPGGGVVGVGAGPGCLWQAASSDTSWLTVSPASAAGSGNGTVEYSVAANTTGQARSATLTAGGQSFTVTQEPNPVALRFVPVAPCRVADTRAETNKAGFTGSQDFPVAGLCGVPAGALAYSLNVSAIPRAASLGFLALWPTGLPQPVVSTLNSFDGRVKADAAIVPAGASGAISVYVSDASDVFLDLNGYFVPAGTAPNGLAYYPVAPCRALDTRADTGKAGFFGTRNVPLAGACGFPANAQAYAVNFTVIPRTASFSFLSAWATGATQPGVSTLNAFTGAVTANSALIPAGTGGSIDIYNTDAADVLVDVSGYFAPPAAGGLSFYTVLPCRAADTRTATTKAGFSGMQNFSLPSSGCNVPMASVYSLNATVLPRPTLDFLSLWATGAAQPGVSTLNSFDQSVVSNAALVPAANGSISAYQTQAADLLLDVNGYFAP